MPTAWRIAKKRHAGSAFDGEGARRFGGRWNSPGTAVIYVAQSRALALLEVLVGLRSLTPTSSYVLIATTFDDALIDALGPDELPEDWRTSPPPSSTRRIGDHWVGERRSAVLRVPSVIVPGEFNHVLNPAHPDFGRIAIGEPHELAIDPRLIQ
jgi:RES domain-containing protein